MEEKELLKKYGYYYSVLQKMGKIPLRNDIVLATDTGISRKEIQMAYNDKEKYEFRSSITDYLCWISTMYLMYHWELRMKSWQNRKAEELLILLDTVLKIYNSDSINTIRLFNKDPNYLFSTAGYKLYYSTIMPFYDDDPMRMRIAGNNISSAFFNYRAMMTSELDLQVLLDDES